MDRLGPTSIPPPLPLTSTPPPTVHDSDNDTMLQCRVTGRYNRSHLSRGLVFSVLLLPVQGYPAGMGHVACLHNVSGQSRLGLKYDWLIYSMLLWFWDDYHSLLPPAHREWHWGPAVSSSSVLLSLLDLYWVIPSYTEDWMSAACCCYGRAILLPQLEHHQFLFFIGASDSVSRQPFSFSNCKEIY